MVPPRSRLEELAERLVAHEDGRSPAEAGPAAAVDAVCRKLEIDLTDMLGSDGVSALFRRALHLAKREWPLLSPVQVERSPASRYAGLAEALADVTPEEAAAVCVAVTAHLLKLLVLLLGEDLGLQPVHRWWPDEVSSTGEIRE